MQVIQDQRHRWVLGSQRRRKLQQEHMVADPPSHRGRQRPRQGNAGFTQRRHDVRPEDPWPVVELIQAGPGSDPGFGHCPQRQGRRLARARRAGDDSQLAPPHVLGDELGDAGALHGPLGHSRRRDLRCRDRIVGGHCGPSGAGRHLAGAMGRHRYLPLVPSPASDVTVEGHWVHLFGIPVGPPAISGRHGRRLPLITTKRQPVWAVHRAIGMKSEPWSSPRQVLTGRPEIVHPSDRPAA